MMLSQEELPCGATLLGVVLSSNKMNISVMSGNHVAHPVLISLANIDAHIHCKTTPHIYFLLALLSIIKFTHKSTHICSLLQDCLVHHCPLALENHGSSGHHDERSHQKSTLLLHFFSCMDSQYTGGIPISSYGSKGFASHHCSVQTLWWSTLTSTLYDRENHYCDSYCLFKIFAQWLQEFHQSHLFIGLEWDYWPSLGLIKPLWFSPHWTPPLFSQICLELCMMLSGVSQCYSQLLRWSYFLDMCVSLSFFPLRTHLAHGGPLYLHVRSPFLFPQACSCWRSYPCSSPPLCFLSGVGHLI